MVSEISPYFLKVFFFGVGGGILVGFHVVGWCCGWWLYFLVEVYDLLRPFFFDAWAAG